MNISTDGEDRDDEPHDAAHSSVHNGRNGETTNGNLNTNGLCQLATNVCEAMEKGDKSEFYSILNISVEEDECTKKDDDESTSTCTPTLGTTNYATPSERCRELLSLFHSLIGYEERDIGGLDIPLSVKAHLLLRALLRIPHKKYSIPWKTATVAIKSLQFSKSNHNSNNQSEKCTLSHGEELAMIAEIRSFVTCLRTGKMEQAALSRTIEQLLELGNTILAPLRMNAKTDESLEIKREGSADLQANKARTLRRRQNSYLLPLELIPAIFATMDSMDDMQADLFVENGNAVKVENDFSTIGDTTEMKHEEEGIMKIHASDKLLSSMFASYIGDVTGYNLQRNMRANALLPLLSLAIDDIGFSRMSSTLSLHEGVSYWDCLKFALNDVIRANLICYSNYDGSIDEKIGKAKQQILDEALSDEIVHIIPLSDYPGLMRCIFRMVATTSSNSLSPPSWESLLLQLYHAVVVATITTPLSSFPRQKMPGSVDSSHRLASFSTVESHVLLPSCTGASVSTIKSILEACIHECCPFCKQDSAKGEFSGVACQQIYSNNSCVVPIWAVAEIVLLVIRARASNPSHSSTGFGPRDCYQVRGRAVFRMASDMIRKEAAGDNNPGKKTFSTGFGGDDEVGYALKVLLHLSEIKKGRCRACCDDRFNEDTENCAYDVLKLGSYYAGNGQFFHRYPAPENGSESYRHQLGLHALSSYSNLVRASLNHGALCNTGKIQSTASIADTAQTWIDAANIFVGEQCSSTNEKASSSIPHGTAMSIVIIIVIFIEVPSSQDAIVRSIYNRLTNMTSGVGSRSEESCFLLISTLAWSLIAIADRRYPSIEVVRTTGDKDHMVSVLGPLCGILSKPAPSHEQCLNGVLTNNNNEATHLSYWALRQLAHALASVVPGREAILAMAQKNMRVLSTSSPYSYSSSKVAPFFESLPSTPSATNNAVYLAIYCLCVLIEKCHPSKNSALDDCGRAALGILTDIIILQRPWSSSSNSHSTYRVPTNAVSWMLLELNNSALSGKLTESVSRRLLRSCFVGLLKCTALEETELEKYSPILLPENIFSMNCSSIITMHNDTNEKTTGITSPPQLVMFQVKYDVPGMLRLAVSLYDRIAKSYSNTHSGMAQSFMESQTLLKSHILQTLLIQPDKIFESALEEASNQNAIGQLFKEDRDVLQKGVNPIDESIDFVIDRIFLTIFIKGAARMIQKKQHGFLERVDNIYMYDAERYCHLQDENVSMIPKHCSPLPGWIKAQHPSIDAIKIYRESIMEVEKTSEEFKLFHMSLCDILVEILLRNWTNHQDGIKIGNQSHEMSVLRGVNSVLGSKRQATQLVICSSANELLLGGMSLNSICSLVELSSQHFRPLISSSDNKKDVLTELDMLVKNVLDLCKTILSKRTSQCMSSQSRILSSFWTLYCSLADEESSQLLSSVVKESYVEIGKWAVPEKNYDISESSFSLLSITSSEDLDYHVRSFRGLFLSALSQALTTIPTSLQNASSEERTAILDLLLQLLPQICQDLDAAFQGYSGGLTKRMMLHFLDVINKCIDAIVALFESIPRSVQYQIKSSFMSVHRASLILWDVFCEKPLMQASVIKGTLRLCIDKMPNIVWRVERVLNECIVKKPLGEYTSELLNQCILSLKSKRIETVTCSDKTDDIGVGVSDGAETSSLNCMVETNGDECKNLFPSEENSKESEPKIERAQMPNISTTETLSWAYRCAFVAVTNIWDGSYRIISGSGKMNKRRVELPGEHSTADETSPYRQRQSLAKCTLTLFRIDGFSRLHTSVCQIFEAKAKPKDKTDSNIGSEDSTEMLAESLSHHGKSNLCSCAEKMAMALTLSVKQIIKYFKESFSQKPFDETKLNESIICLLGWLYSVKTKETRYDIITGPLQWYIREKRNFHLSSFVKNTNGSHSILARLPKLLFRLEGLDAEIRKLDFIVADLSLRDDGISRENLLLLNQMMSAVTREGNQPQEQGHFMEILRQCIEIMDSHKNTMKTSEMNDNTLSDEDQSDADIGGEAFTWMGKRKKRCDALIRKSRRVSLRSRNETIDNWLTMDDDEFGSAQGEKCSVNDAFVDLEDFIVEG